MSGTGVQSQVVEEINRRVDPLVLLERIAYRTDTVRQVGTQVKCFCPLHGEDKFATLMVDLSKKTFKCAVRTCVGSKGGNLVEFFALLQNQPSILQAAFALAKFTDVQIDEGLLHRLCGDFIAEGRRALEAGRAEEAMENVVHALEVDANHIEAHLLASRIAQARGAFGESLEHAQRAGMLAEAIGDWPLALEITRSYILELLPDDEETLLHEADIHDRLGNAQDLLGILRRVISARLSRGDEVSIIPLLERMLKYEPHATDTLLQLGRAHEVAGEPDSAARRYLEGAEQLEAHGDLGKALEILIQVKSLAPALWAARERLADAFRRSDRTQEALREYLNMAELALAAADEVRAESYYRILLGWNEDLIEAREGILRVLEARGDNAAAAREYLSLAAVHDRANRGAEALDCLRRARHARPDDNAIRRLLIERLLTADEKHDAIHELVEFGGLLFQQGDRDGGREQLRRASGLAELDLDIHLMISSIYLGAGFEQEGWEECARTALSLQGAGRHTDAVTACENAIQLRPDDLETLQVFVRSLRALKRDSAALDTYRVISRLQLEKKDDAGAESTLEAALELDPDNLTLRAELVSLYERKERTDDALLVLRNMLDIQERRDLLDESIETGQKILSLAPADDETRERIARQFVKKGWALEAIELYEAAAEGFEKREDFKAARRNLEAVLDVDPLALTTLERLGNLLVRTEGYAAAESTYATLLNALKERGDDDETANTYDRILARVPEQAELRRVYAEWLMHVERREAAFAQWLGLAESLEKAKDLDGAALVYLQLTGHDPERLDFRVGLGRLYEELGDSPRAAEEKTKAATILLAQGRKAEAADLLEDILHLTPTSEKARTELAELYVAENRPKDAARHFVELADVHKRQGHEEDNVELFRRILSLDEELDGIRKRLAEVLEHSGETTEACEQWLLLAERHEKAKKIDEAIALVRKVVELEPEDARARRRLVALVSIEGNEETIFQEEDALVALLTSQGEYDEATELLRGMRERRGDDLALAERLGRILMQQGRKDEACVLYIDTARRHLAQSEFVMARALLVTVREAAPENEDARLLLANATEKLGDARGAAREYLDLLERALESDRKEVAAERANEAERIAGNDWDVLIAVARSYESHGAADEGVGRLLAASGRAIAQKDIKGALRLTETALSFATRQREVRECRIEAFRSAGRNADAVIEYRELAALVRGEGELEAAAIYLQTLLELAPGDIAARLELADLLLALSDSKGAVEELARVVDLQAAVGHHDEATATASRALQIEPERTALRQKRVTLCLSAGRVEEAVEELQTLADQAFKEHRWSDAEEHLEQILKHQPDSLPVLRQLTEAASKHRAVVEVRPFWRRRLETVAASLPYDEASAEYRLAREFDADCEEFALDFARYLQSQGDKQLAAEQFEAAESLLVARGELAEALDVLEELIPLREGESLLLARKADLCQKLGRDKEAREAYAEAGEIALKAGRTEEGAKHLGAALAFEPENEALLKRLADLHRETGKTEESAALYERIADIAEGRGATEAVVTALETVLELDAARTHARERLARNLERISKIPQAVLRWVEVGRARVAAGDLIAAVAVYRHVKELDPAEIDTREELVGLLRRLEKADEARNELHELVDVLVDLGEVSRGEELLIEAAKLDEADHSFPRRLAGLYENSNRPKEAAEALRALARACTGSGEVDGALDAWRRVSGLEPADLKAREAVIELLELTDQKEDASSEAIALAAMHIAQAAMDEGIMWLDRSVGLGGGGVESVIRAAEVLHDSGHDEETRRWFDRASTGFLERGDAKAAAALYSKCLEWYAGDPATLEGLAKTYLAQGDSAKSLATVKQIARIWGERGDADKQEATWRRAIESAPEDLEAHEGLIATLEARGADRGADTITAILALAAVHTEGERSRKAVDCYRKALDIDAKRKDVREALADILLAMGDWPSALEEYLHLAQQCQEMQDAASARKFNEKVLELDPENIDALRTLMQLTREAKDAQNHARFSMQLAEIYLQVSAVEDAILCLRELVEVSPERVDALAKLAGLLESAEMSEDAAPYWEQLATLQELEGELPQLFETLQKLEKTRAADVNLRRKLAKLAEALKDPSAPQRFSNLADSCEAAGDLVAAAEAVEKYIELAQGHPNARRRLARLSLSQGDTQKAIKEFASAAQQLETSGADADAAATYGELLSLAPERNDDRERYRILLQRLGDSDRACEQLLLLAEAYEQTGNDPRSISRCRDVLQMRPGNFEAHLRLFQLHTRRSEVALAIVEANWLAEHYRSRGELEKVQQTLETGLALDSGNIDLMERLAALHVEAGRPEEATSQYVRIAEAALGRGDLQRATAAMMHARDSNPDDIEIRRNLAEILLRQGNTVAARDESFEIARLSLAQGLVADARGTLDALMIQNPKDAPLRERVAQLYVDHGIPELAALQFVDLARIEKANNSPREVIRHAQEALRLKPRTIEAKELLVEAQLQTGQVDAAFATYSELADLHLQTAAPEKAITCLSQMKDMRPADLATRVRLVDALQRANLPDPLAENLRELAQLQAEEKQYEDAVVSWKKLLALRPDDTQARFGYIQTFTQIGDEREVVGDYMHLAEVYAARGDHDDARTCFQKALAIAPENLDNHELYIDYLMRLGDLVATQNEADSVSQEYLKTDRAREAAALLQKVLGVLRDNAALRLRLAEALNRLNARGNALKELRAVVVAFERANNREGLVTTLRRILEIDNQNVETRQRLIVLLEESNRIQELVDEHTQLADVYMGRGLLDLARDEYREILRVQPDNLLAWSYLVSAREQLGEVDGLGDDYYQMGAAQARAEQFEEAATSFRRAIDRTPGHVAARQSLIEVLLRSKPESALVDDFLALADALVKEDRIDEALQIYSKVVSLEPKNEVARQKFADTQARLARSAGVAYQAEPEPLDVVPPEPVGPTAEDMLPDLGTGTEEEAGLEQVITNYLDILQVNPQNANVRIKLADIYEQTGRREEALNELVQASEIFFQKSELHMCVSVCERILKVDPANGRVRERLSKAVLKRDAFRALESAILFSDQAQQDDMPRKPGTKAGTQHPPAADDDWSKLFG